MPSRNTPAYASPTQVGAGRPVSARPLNGIPSTSRGGTVSTTESDVVGTLPTAQAPRPYGSSAIGRPISQPIADVGAARSTPVSQPGHDPAASRPSIERPRPISQPAYSPAAPPRPITRPANDPYSTRAPAPPIAGSSRPISHPAHDPSRPVSQPAYDPGRPVSRPNFDPGAPAQAQSRPVTVGGIRISGSQQTYRSESSGHRPVGVPASKPGSDPFAARPSGNPISQSGLDPYAPRPQSGQAGHAAPNPALLGPTLGSSSQPTSNPQAPRLIGGPISRPAHDPFAARPLANPISQSAMDPFAPRALLRPISQPAVDPFAAAGRGAPVSRTTSDPFQPQGPLNAPRPQAQQPTPASQPGAVVDPEFVALAHGMAFSPTLAEPELLDLAAIVGRKVVEPGQAILKQGQPADQGAIVGSGVGHMNYATPGRQPVDFGEIQPGDIIGDGAVSGGGYHGCTVIADSACVVWTFSAAQMVDLNRRNPALTAKLKGLVLLQQGRR